MLSTRYWQHQLHHHTVGVAAGSHIGSGDSKTSSRGWGYRQVKATDLIRGVRGSTISEISQDHSKLKAQEAVSSWLRAQLLLYLRLALSHQPRLSPLSAAGTNTWEERLLHSCGYTQTSPSCASANAHVFSYIDLYWTNCSLPGSAPQKSLLCCRSFITDC